MKLKPFTLVIAVILLIYPTQTFSQNVKKVAILETVDKEDRISYSVELLIRSSLSTAITLSPGYEGYARTNLDQILKEQNFQRTGLVSPSQIKKLGELMGAQYILITEAAMFDDSITMLIMVNVIDVESGEIIKSIEDTSNIAPVDLKECCRNLAKRIFGLKGPKTPQVPQTSSQMGYRNSTDNTQQFHSRNEEPSFEGGDINTFPDWVSSRVYYPKEAAEKSISGRVLVRFTIECDGSMSNVAILQSPHPSLSNEVVRILKTSPKWNPGYSGNTPIRCTYTMPVDFKLHR